MLLSTIHREIGTKKSFKAWLKANGYEGDAEVGRKEAFLLIMRSKNETAREEALKVLDSLERLEKQVEELSTVKVPLLQEGWTVREDDIYVSSLYLADLLKVKHADLLKNIRDLLTFINEESLRESALSVDFAEDLAGIVERLEKGFVFQPYIDPTGRELPAYLLNEAACITLMARKSKKFGLLIGDAFMRYRRQCQKYEHLLGIAQSNPQLIPRASHIYIMVKDIDPVQVKIGVTANLTTRLTSVQNGSMEDVSYYYVTKPCSNAYQLEKQVHKILKDKGITWKREWFQVNPETAKDILQEVQKGMLLKLGKAKGE